MAAPMSERQSDDRDANAAADELADLEPAGPEADTIAGGRTGLTPTPPAPPPPVPLPYPNI
jgi:hypothetical protein